VPLKKEMGFLGSFSMGFADVGADIFLALGLIAMYAGGAMPLAILAAAAVYLLTGLAYAELSSAIPVAGGAAVFGERAFGKLAGFLGGWGLMLDYTLDIALFAVAATGYLSFFLPGIRESVMLAGFSVPLFALTTGILIAILAAVNLFGIKESSLVNSVLTVGTIFLVLIIIGVGVTTTFKLDTFTSGFHIAPGAKGAQDFLYSITLAMVAFIGIESISQGAEETRNPEKVLPRATLSAVITVIVFALAISILSLGIVTPEALASHVDNPLVALAAALPFTDILLPIVALAGFAVCFVSANTGIIGVSRVTYSMSNHGLLTRRFKWVHPRYCTPWLTICLFSGVAVILAGAASWDGTGKGMFFLGELYAFGALMAYLIANLAVVKLRFSEPFLARPFHIPLNIKWRGVQVPVLGILGIAGAILMLGLIAWLHEAGRNFAFAWFIVGVGYFFYYQNYRRKLEEKEKRNAAVAN